MTIPDIRSNQIVTEFACAHLGFFLTGSYSGSGTRSKGNTTVMYKTCENLQVFEVFLFNERIFSLRAENWKVATINISFTDFYDHDGNPTKAVIERLNGLLDRLGIYKIIPYGVRVFQDKDARLTYLGSGDNKIAVGEDYARSVAIRPYCEPLHIVGPAL